MSLTNPAFRIVRGVLILLLLFLLGIIGFQIALHTDDVPDSLVLAQSQEDNTPETPNQSSELQQ